MSVTTMAMQSPPSAMPSSEIETGSPMDTVSRQDFGVVKQRKYSSTGGGRAWSEQEEVYLLQTRLQKMPYKHIAAHLKKTELACRLHYHQLSHGTNRRKRATSMSSCSSGQSPITPDQRLSPDVEISTPISPPDQSPIDAASFKLWNIREDSRSDSGSPHVQSQKPLLPKPIPSFPNHTRAINKALRLDCRTNIGSQQRRGSTYIDQERLRRAYEAHRVSFWKMIAAEYGEGVDPAVLEETWRDGSSMQMMTPDSSIAPDQMPHNRRMSAPLAPSAMSAPVHSEHRERSFSPINYAGSQSAVQANTQQVSRLARAYTLPPPSCPNPTPASATMAKRGSIADLLTNDVDTRRLPKIDTTLGPSRDVFMKDAEVS